MPQNFKLILIIAIHFLGFPLAAQNYNGNSFYSMPGLGDFYPYGNIRNIGMGGVGLSMSHTDFINNVNPALLHANKILNLDSAGGNRHSVFDASMILTLQNSRTSNTSQTNLSANFDYFSYAVPIPFSSESRMHNRWTTNIGMQQFTKVAYKASFREAVAGGSPGDSVLYGYTGSGGLYQAYWGNGIDITKNLSIGLQLSYIFGNRTDESIIQFIIPPSQQNQSLLSLKTNHNSIQVKPGIVYRKAITKGKNRGASDKETEDKIQKSENSLGKLDPDQQIYFNLGLVSDFFTAVHGKQITTVEQRDSLRRVFNVNTFDTTNRKVSIPSVYRLGISFDKPKSWSIGSDFSYSRWTNYSGFDKNSTFINSYTFALGGERYLNPTSKSSRGDDAARKIIRAGFTYTKMPFLINKAQVNDISVSLGGTIPLLGGQKRIQGSAPPTKLNLALIAGERGSKSGNLIQEFYVKLYLGMVMSDLWFLKSKVE
jgi:hypothetical protein